MNADRELLELAAKAAGYEVNFDEPVNGWYANGYDDNGDPSHWWNPLKSDGDALRLAVKLSMSVEISEHEDSTYAYAGPQPRVYGYEMWKGDKDAATRRAIVLAAAELGRRTK